jgi:hypothetical protein
MNRARRIRLLLLVALLAASQLILLGHLAAHAQPVVEHCALCASHAQPQAAIPAAEQAVQATATAVCRDEPTVPPVSCIPPRRFQPRAPPAASS